MLLWDIIRDWFVMNIWGGTSSEAYDYYTSFGRVFIVGNGSETSNSVDLMLPVKLFNGNYGSEVSYISIGDWLSTTSTIIVLIAICVGFFFLVRWLFRLTAGLIAGRG